MLCTAVWTSNFIFCNWNVNNLLKKKSRLSEKLLLKSKQISLGLYLQCQKNCISTIPDFHECNQGGYAPELNNN